MMHWYKCTTEKEMLAHGKCLHVVLLQSLHGSLPASWVFASKCNLQELLHILLHSHVL